MAAYAILIGIKSGKKESVLVDEPDLVRLAYKEEVLKGTSCKFDSIEIVDTRSGRLKRWRNTKATAAKKAAKEK